VLDVVSDAINLDLRDNTAREKGPTEQVAAEAVGKLVCLQGFANPASKHNPGYETINGGKAIARWNLDLHRKGKVLDQPVKLTVNTTPFAVGGDDNDHEKGTIVAVHAQQAEEQLQGAQLLFYNRRHQREFIIKLPKQNDRYRYAELLPTNPTNMYDMQCGNSCGEVLSDGGERQDAAKSELLRKNSSGAFDFFINANRYLPVGAAVSIIGKLTFDSSRSPPFTIEAHPKIGLLLFRFVDFVALRESHLLRKLISDGTASFCGYAAYICLGISAARILAHFIPTRTFPPDFSHYYNDSSSKDSSFEGVDESECGICLSRRRLPTACAPCGHVFCQVCLQLAMQRKRKCPTCATAIRETVLLFG